MSPNDINSALGWVCSNQQMVGWILAFLAAHFSFSLISAAMKKLGISSVDASKAGAFVINVIRLLAADAHPTDAVILKQANAVADRRDMPVSAAVATAVAGAPLPEPKTP